MLDVLFTAYDWTANATMFVLVLSLWALLVLVIFDTARKVIQDYRDDQIVKATNRRQLKLYTDLSEENNDEVR